MDAPCCALVHRFEGARISTRDVRAADLIPHAAVENRSSLRGSGSPTRLALDELQDARRQHGNVVENIDVAGMNIDQADLTVAAASIAAAATARISAGGNEIEFLIGQFDGVSKCGHLLHVDLLSMKWRGFDMIAATSFLVLG
jgi:hypothetical protein